MLKNYIMGIQHVGIPTNEIDDTIKFYTGLGFQILLRTENEVSGEKVAFLVIQNLVIETYENKNTELRNGAIDHICLDVNDIETVFHLTESMGYEILNHNIQHLSFWENGVDFFTIVGPNKEKIEFCQKL